MPIRIIWFMDGSSNEISTDLILAQRCRRGRPPQHPTELRSSHLPLDHVLLDLGDRLRRIEVFWTGLRAVHDGVAAIEAERILEIVEPLAGGLVARVHDPPL